MTSDTSVRAGSQEAGRTSDTAGASAGLAAPGPRRGKAPTSVSELYATVFDDYAGDLSRPGGPLDTDTVRAYLSRVRQFLAWLPDADTHGELFAWKCIA